MREATLVGAVGPAMFSPTWTHTENGLTKRDKDVFPDVHTPYELLKGFS